MQYVEGGVYAYDNGTTLILFENGGFLMFGWDGRMSVSDVENTLNVDRAKIGDLVLTLPLSSNKAG
jgi:hypothetical protein